MFQIGRFDPRAEEQANAKKKRRKKSKISDDPEDAAMENKKRKKEKNKEIPSSSLRVIAPETKGGLSQERKLNAKVNGEAFDDLDLEENEMFKEEHDGDDDDDDNDDELAEYPPQQHHQQQPDSEKEEIFDPKDELQRARYMSSLPLLQAAHRWKLADFLIENLQADGYQNFFPIQSLVLSDILSSANNSSSGWQRDVCVAAPTGSGKTLAFVLPVLQTLWTRKVRRLRALCVLPSRDLANQVYQVFEHYAKGSDLKIGLAIGQSNFQQEQEALIVGSGVDVRSSSTHLAAFRSRLYPGDLRLALDHALEVADIQGQDAEPSIDKGGKSPMSMSAVDVLVCTPGRLVDHVDNTPGFSLEHLRFLIIDEADRLLSQSYHGWIGRVLDQVQQTSSRNMKASIANPRRSSKTLQLRKWLYSATLTKDPQKLAALQLVHPKQFSMEVQATNSRSVYSMPPQLEEYTISCLAEQKPLVLVSLLMEFMQQQQQENARKKDLVVVFTSSLESTHRLTRLLQLLWPAVFADNEDGISDEDKTGVPVAECSSSLSQKQKSKLVEDCNDKECNRPRILVCSDGMSRGMDLEYVTMVINYDVPGFAKTYVHRCGRTARAGKSGKAISLLKGKGQMGTFRKLRSLIGNPERVQTFKCDTTLITPGVLLEYKESLRRLSQVLASESEGELNPTHPIPAEL
jgi:ATP-dependent RNA helicase DDX51/DBP6